jgi:hypothetical protein
MPIISGNCGSGKPIANIVIAPALPGHGPVEPSAGPSPFNVTSLRALLDTGADGTSISTEVARSHQLRSYGRRTVVGIGGPGKHLTWGVYVGFLFDSRVDFEGDGSSAQSVFMVPDPKLAVEIPSNSEFDVIIGRDILTMFDFTMKRGGNWSLDLS